MSNTTPQNENEGHIKCHVMDRTGDTRYDGVQNPLLTQMAAINLARDEMAKGKWLRTVDPNGKSDIIQDVKDIGTDEKAEAIFENVEEMALVAAVQGG